MRRAFDSAPPDGELVFRADGRLLRHYSKQGGLYVFPDTAAREIFVSARGFQPETVPVTQGETARVFLYPRADFRPPSGWRTVTGEAPPGAVVTAEDSRELKILACDPEHRRIRLWWRQGFTGGALLLERGGERELVLIVEKQPPDLYDLNRLSRDYTGGRAALAYPARAGEDGSYTAAIPVKLENARFTQWEGG